MRLSISSLYSQLSSAQKGTFRKNKSRLIKRGLAAEEAERQAAQFILRHLPKGLRNEWLEGENSERGDKSLKIQEKCDSDFKVELESAEEIKKPAAPTDQEVKHLVESLKDKGVMVETDSKPFIPPCEQMVTTQPQPLFSDLKAENPISQLNQDSHTKKPLPLVHLVIVLGATVLLVTNTAELFGQGWQGWMKAGLLEIGILALVVYAPKKIMHKIFSRLSLAFLIGLSFFSLYAGVEASRTEAFTNSEALRHLKDRRTRLLQNHDSLPASHVTKRQMIMTQLEALDTQILQQKQKPQGNSRAEAITLRHDSELLMRAALLLLNLIFAHSVTKTLSDWFPGLLGQLGSSCRKAFA